MVHREGLQPEARTEKGAHHLRRLDQGPIRDMGADFGARGPDHLGSALGCGPNGRG